MNGSYGLLAPEIILAVCATLMLMLSVTVPRERRNGIGWVGIIGLVAAFVSAARLAPAVAWVEGSTRPVLPFWGSATFAVDSFSVYFSLLVIIAGILVSLASLSYVQEHLRAGVGEFYAVLVYGILGMCLMASASDLISIYVAIEFTSICSYIMAGYMRADSKSAEAGVKYFLIGAVSSAVMLYGMSLLYGFTGHTGLADIGAAAATTETAHPIIILSVCMILAGFGFKLAAVPFHMWCPDVFEGAPTPISALLSVGPKAAGLAVLIRFMDAVFGPGQMQWSSLIAVVAAASMTLGNVVALVQTNAKRMLAYSTIAQVGYMLVGVAATGPEDWRVPGVLLYMLTYLFMNIGAFAAVIALSRIAGSDEIEDYAGLAQRAPMMAGAFLVCVWALAGLPPTSGFWGKAFVFGAAIHSGLLWLALLGVANSVISVYYYFNVVRLLYFGAAADKARVESPPTLRVAVALTVIATLVIGIWPQPFIEMARGSILTFVARGGF